MHNNLDYFYSEDLLTTYLLTVLLVYESDYCQHPMSITS